MHLTSLIPVFNTKPHHLIEAVESIKNQEPTYYKVDDKDVAYTNRIILIDDCSTNADTRLVLDWYAENGIEVVRMPENGGTSKALNYGHSLVNTEYVAIMGSDDISHPSRFKLQIDFLNSHKDVDVLGTNIMAYYDDDIFREPAWKSNMLPDGRPPYSDQRWRVCHGSVIYRNRAVIDSGGYQHHGRGQDVALWGQMAEQGYKFANIMECLYLWRRFR